MLTEPDKRAREHNWQWALDNGNHIGFFDFEYSPRRGEDWESAEIWLARSFYRKYPDVEFEGAWRWRPGLTIESYEPLNIHHLVEHFYNLSARAALSVVVDDDRLSSDPTFKEAKGWAKAFLRCQPYVIVHTLEAMFEPVSI